MNESSQKNKIPNLRQVWPIIADVIIPNYKALRLSKAENAQLRTTIFNLNAENTKLEQESADTITKLTEKSITDSLTGLFNLTGFHSYAKNYLNALRRHRYTPPVDSDRIAFDDPPEELKRKIDGRSIVVIDVDKFKAVNDRYGHAAGDKVLKNIAKILKNTVRPGDEVFRTGGDEFTILLAMDNAKGAKKFFHRLQYNLDSDHKRRLEGGEVSATATVGFSVVNKSGRSPISTARQWADLVGYVNKRKRYPVDELRASLPQAPIRKMI